MELRTVNYPLLQPRTSDTGELRFASWNVWYGTSPAHGEAVVSALQSFDCDVLMLFEVIRDRRIPERLHDLGYGGVFVEASYNTLSWRSLDGGVALFSRYPIEDVRIIETNVDGFFRVRRYYIEARLKIREGFSITVGMTHHALPFQPGFGRACETLLREVARHKERFLFAGDLNVLPWFRVIKQLHDRFVHIGPPLHVPSYPMNRWMRGVWRRRLDYGFGTRDMAKRILETRFGDSYPSDHAPLLGRLNVA